MKRIVVVVVVVMAGLALAATQFTRMLHLQVLGKTLLGTTTETNAITRSLYGSAAIDFAAGTILCDESPITVTGALVGDACSVGMPSGLGLDGGAGLNATFSCSVSATNTVQVRHCPAGTADDPPSATFKVRVISEQ